MTEEEPIQVGSTGVSRSRNSSSDDFCQRNEDIVNIYHSIISQDLPDLGSW